ncbi:MAG: hypothetical protein U9N84_15030 [Actinomycetota bacterium]|nr:hypothetical protein [Actinomycetota bacterium]
MQLDPDTLPDDVLATFDRDGSADLNTLVNLTIGNSILDANFGFQVGLPVTGFEVERFAIWGLLMTLLGGALIAMAKLQRRLRTTA